MREDDAAGGGMAIWGGGEGRGGQVGLWIGLDWIWIRGGGIFDILLLISFSLSFNLSFFFSLCLEGRREGKKKKEKRVIKAFYIETCFPAGKCRISLYILPSLLTDHARTHAMLYLVDDCAFLLLPTPPSSSSSSSSSSEHPHEASLWGKSLKAVCVVRWQLVELASSPPPPFSSKNLIICPHDLNKRFLSSPPLCRGRNLQFPVPVMNETTAFAHTHTSPGSCLNLQNGKLEVQSLFPVGFMMPVLGGKLVDGSFVAVGLLLDYSSCSYFSRCKYTR